MSESVYQPDHKPFFSDSALTYLGVIGAVVIAIIVFLGAAAVSTPDEARGVSEKLKAERIAKREEVNGAGFALISAYGKSTSTKGDFRIPITEAVKLIASNPAALDAARGVNADK